MKNWKDNEKSSDTIFDNISTYINTTSRGAPQVDKKKAFCELLNNILPDEDKSIVELIEEFDNQIKTVEPRVTGGALSNCHGDWYEWLLAIAGWNFFVNNETKILPMLLPNVRRFDVATLYQQDLVDLIEDLRNKVQEATSVRLVTSNPDFVLIDTEQIEFELPLEDEITIVTEETIDKLETLYQAFIGRCSFEEIVGYLSVKTSLRPDRRLQIPHEGSLMKAMYTHLQTRKWVLSPKGIKYYAITCATTDADVEALKTVATHSITTVNSIPQAAVDDVFSVNTLIQARDVYQVILAE